MEMQDRIQQELKVVVMWEGISALTGDLVDAAMGYFSSRLVMRTPEFNKERMR